MVFDNTQKNPEIRAVQSKKILGKKEEHLLSAHQKLPSTTKMRKL